MARQKLFMRARNYFDHVGAVSDIMIEQFRCVLCCCVGLPLVLSQKNWPQLLEITGGYNKLLEGSLDHCEKSLLITCEKILQMIVLARRVCKLLERSLDHCEKSEQIT